MEVKGCISVDFDGTITDRNEFPKIGNLRPYAKEVIQKLQDKGYFVYLWTCRHADTLEDAKNFLEENGIKLNGYNEGPWTGSLKLIADVYIDDMAYPNNGKIDWKEVAEYFNIELDD